VAGKLKPDVLAALADWKAGKAVKYGGLSETEALAMVTLNPAKQLGIENRVGSIEAGKDADLVLWDGYPLSSYGVPAKVWIDGDLYFDRSLPGLGMPHFQEGE